MRTEDGQHREDRRALRPRGRNVAAAALTLCCLVGAVLPVMADEAPAVKLTDEEQKKADELDKEALLAKKQTDAITAQTALAKAKVAAATPATGADITAPSGAVTGANSMTFAMYMLSIESLHRVAQAICNDLGAAGVDDLYTSIKDVAEAVAKDEAATRGREQLKLKLQTAKTQADRMAATISGTGAEPKISAASLTAIASGIDVAAGLIKGAAGLASLFKSERKIESADNLLTSAEVSASLTMCVGAAPNRPAPKVRNVDGNLKRLTEVIGVIGNEVNQVSVGATALDDSLTKLAAASAALDKEKADATAKKDKEKLLDLDKRSTPLNYADFKAKAATLVTQAQAYVDTVYQVDSTTGLSPLIVSAQFRALREAATSDGSKRRLVLSLLKSSGYTLTTKRLFLNDRVDYAGGVALRATVLDETGVSIYDRIFFRDSGWVRADFKSSGDTIERQNF